MGDFIHTAGFVLLAMLMVACASSSDTTEPVGSGHGQCALRNGTYRSDYTTRSGTCGPQQESIAGGPQPAPGPVAGCTGPGISYSADNCEVQFDSTCPSDAIVKGGSLRGNGSSKWDVAGDYGTATLQLMLFAADGTVICAGTYDATIDRQ